MGKRWMNTKVISKQVSAVVGCPSTAPCTAPSTNATSRRVVVRTVVAPRVVIQPENRSMPWAKYTRARKKITASNEPIP